jgi:hypothetical protein
LEAMLVIELSFEGPRVVGPLGSARQ